MSKLTKYLKQSATLQLAERNDKGLAVMDKYGEVVLQEAITVKCRDESLVEDVETSTGAVMQSKNVFYLDNSVEIQIGDYINGSPVLTVSNYVNRVGKVEGYKAVI